MENRQLFLAIDEWLDIYKKNSVKAATFDRLNTSLALMKRYSISLLPVDDISTDDIQDYVNLLVDDGYALSTIKKQYHLISAFMDYASYSGMINRPVHKGVRLPSESAVDRHKKEVVAYNHEEQAALKKVLLRGDSPASYAALFMMETGLRVGEALALGWDDVLWGRQAIRVHKTVVRVAAKKQSFIQMSAKSHSSNRTIPINAMALEILQRLKRDGTDSSFVFHDESGDRIGYEALRWWVKKACVEANVPYYGQHAFRHTFATNCYERGCDVKRLSKLLGHSDVTITYNVYIHLFGDAIDEMRSVLG